MSHVFLQIKNCNVKISSRGMGQAREWRKGSYKRNDNEMNLHSNQTQRKEIGKVN